MVAFWNPYRTKLSQPDNYYNFMERIMAELFFKYEAIPYLLDTKLLKLFRIVNKELIEINQPEILREIRFNSIEITRNDAFCIEQWMNK